MSIINRRNALIGWATWSVIKRTAAMQAKRAKGAAADAVPKKSGGSKGKKAVKAGAIAAAAAAAGLVVFWKAKHRDSTDHDSFASEELDTTLD
jgi:uncharacterized protein HemX